MKAIKNFLHLEDYIYLTPIQKVIHVALLIVAISLMACGLSLFYALFFAGYTGNNIPLF